MSFDCLFRQIMIITYQHYVTLVQNKLYYFNIVKSTF